MLKNFLIFSLCFVAIKASGEFAVLHTPTSLTFKGEQPISTDSIGDVWHAAMGSPVAGDVTWDALYINDPFALGHTRLFTVHADGVRNLNFGSTAKTYALEGRDSKLSLDEVTNEVKQSNEAACDLDLDEADLAEATCFGEAPAALPLPKTAHLDPELHSGDKKFLQAISYLNTLGGANTALKLATFNVVRVSLQPIVKAHGAKSPAVAEAAQLLVAAVADLNARIQKANNDEVLFTTVTSADAGERQKREVIGSDAKNPYNLAEYYNDDYPVIFNIILWFMVAFGFSLLAICYAIGSMDPGRDSIIYRMTSTRMKKDN